jgi:hypothetical protein
MYNKDMWRQINVECRFKNLDKITEIMTVKLREGSIKEMTMHHNKEVGVKCHIVYQEYIVQ